MSSDNSAAGNHVTPYDRLARGEQVLTELLASGRERATLTDFFGAELYAELAPLARRALKTRARRNGHVFVVPGIMSSQLGVLRDTPRPPNVIWVDPIDMAVGRLAMLSLASGVPIEPLGVLLYGHLKLALRLRGAGYAPVLWDYDWRLGIDASGTRLARDIAALDAGPVAIVAHSMGGLVARHALTHAGGQRVSRLVLLGVPHFGSFAAVQALRGTYSVVRKIAMLDLRHSAEELASQVFGGFPSLYHLLPARGRSGSLDLHDANDWPRTGPVPQTALLAASRDLEQLLAPVDERYVGIIGSGRSTATSIARRGGDFVYTYSDDGDGTVPVANALLPGAPHYYVTAAHSDLPRNDRVIAATLDLLATGATRQLDARRLRTRRRAERWTDAQLRALHNGKLDWSTFSPTERRQFLDSLNEPPAARAARRAGASRRTAALNVAVVVGDVAAQKSGDAVAVAVLRNVRPRGAVAALDAALGGTIRELIDRRMVSADAGAVTSLPAQQQLGAVQAILLVGLGAFDLLEAATVEHAAANVGWMCRRSGYAHLVTVPWAAGTGMAPETSVVAQLAGLRQAVALGQGTALARITVVARDAHGARAMHSALNEWIATSSAAAEPVVRLAPLRIATAKRRVALKPATKPSIAYLLVHAERARERESTWRGSLLTAGREAAVTTQHTTFETARLEKLAERVESRELTTATIRRVGAALGQLVLHPTLLRAIGTVRAHPIAVVHDAAASRMPWETLNIGGWYPALRHGLSRRFQSSALAPARFDAAQREDRILRILLVTNPTRDLPGAELERQRMVALLARQRNVELIEVSERAATGARVLAELASGRYDVVHYAGHAFFDAARRDVSGLVLADGDLTGAMLAGVSNLPPLVVFNACESARIRRAQSNTTSSRTNGIVRNIGIAETLLDAGVANYIGTNWSVGDAAATEFASALYPRLLRGEPIGTAIVFARRAIHAQRSPDWADYVHYGDPDFRLKR
jgi:CHAT domain-containing protein